MELSPVEIHKEIQKTPLYQQEDLFKHYEGIDIKGIGSLLSINLDNIASSFFKEDKLENGVYVEMLTYDKETDSLWYPTICCYADLNKYPELKFKKNKQKILFTGKLKKVYSNAIYVINPEFNFENATPDSKQLIKDDEKTESNQALNRKIHIEKLEIINGDKVNKNKIEQHGKKNKASIKNGDSESFLSKFFWHAIAAVFGLIVIYVAFRLGFNN
ncbi:hypothetical protein A2641_03065 [Candidatus Nomurabacteria bacterium RIFCSPHIGHO2_01_FULL_37_25]|uniref:Uncharacterized protein n=1 Tax=Candidatus Nomurabacteria bacterium RIFCSPLOWO2_01_FULL_36_16 TaxID=1801767 RepID=A0A1F6WZK3_9BACT|nr:MAG: hypothetical protein A2641_03065 [Candidatus Nomurabacteria bacterium RIFCSPHIGHO2_01_FULL_37_25]OGI75472.1 MAG: hypothetical protein A3D36_02710 [Candidatus Nomurabacteria bacterium RIFCSPHIGHO2_02_FULL_36_29]OGI87310.1 MAG: hypothetical protein A3A91_02330 [Candidatus Nomurabacteria bacterium RIFCSPLOWO2_01_FULL_36_16]